MGFGEFISGIGHALETAREKIEDWTSFAPAGVSVKAPIEQLDLPGVHEPAPNGPIGGLPNAGIEQVNQGVRWLRDNAVSHPLSTLMLQINTQTERGANDGGPNPFFSASDWVKAWHAAQHISPLQAFALDNTPGDVANRQSEQAINSPLEYYTPAESSLPPGFKDLSHGEQQQILKDAGMPATGNAYIENRRRESAFFKYATGVGDAALAWWADPTILGGKVLGAIREAKVVQRMPVAGWSAADINRIVDGKLMTKFQDYVWAHKDNPQLLNNTATAQNSAMGPRFGAIAQLLKSPDEVNDFLRVGMGDVNAIERLQSKNLLAASRIQQDTSRLSALDGQWTRYGADMPPAMQALMRAHMDQLSANISADTALVNRYEQIAGKIDENGVQVTPGIAHQLDELNLSHYSFARAEEKTEAQNLYAARAAQGRGPRQYAFTPGVPAIALGQGMQQARSPIESGLVKTRIYGIGDFFSSPITLVRSFSNYRPNGYMPIDEINQDAINELRAQIARIPSLSAQERGALVNQYLKTQTEGQRMDFLRELGSMGAEKIAQKYGMTAEDGAKFYQEHLGRQMGEIDNMKQYSAGKKPVQMPDGTIARIRVDGFLKDGEKVVVHPNLVTRLANDHVFQDLSEMDKVFARHSSALSALRETKFGNTDWLQTGADFFTHLWKFSTLLRFGYIPRVLGDDLGGQAARLGAVNMALRAKWGIENGLTNAALNNVGKPLAGIRRETALNGIKYAEDRMAGLESEMAPLQAHVAGVKASNLRDLQIAQNRVDRLADQKANLPADATPAQQAALDTLLTQRQRELDLANRRATINAPGKNLRLQSLQQQYGFLDRYRGLQQRVVDELTARIESPKIIQGSQPIDLGDGVMAPPALAGSRAAEYSMKRISADETVGQMFLTNKQLIHGYLQRSFDHGGKVISATTETEAEHAQAWADAINKQLAQDELARMAIKNSSIQDMTKWMYHTPAGRAYVRRIGLNFTPPEELANSAWHDVHDYLPLRTQRAQALTEEGVTPEFLKDSMPMALRPDVHGGQVGVNAQLKFRREIDRIIGQWYQFAASLPANRLSRHPLFNQLYEGHLNRIKNTLQKQGAYDTTVNGVEQMAYTARSLAERDMKKLVFDIAHRSDIQGALRFVSPFMSATSEAFQRWGRIIADKPETVGYASNFYSAPASLGWMQDQDGNHVGPDGYAYTLQYPIDQKTGQTDYTAKPTVTKTLVPKSNRFIITRIPSWAAYLPGTKIPSPLAIGLGANPATGDLKLSQNSVDLVTQGDPWYHPGVGPIVQIPVNEFVKDKPKDAEVARKLGILPFGPSGGSPGARVASFMVPSTLGDFLTGLDTSDARYQAVKMQILQRALFEADPRNGLGPDGRGKPMPTPQQISDMTRNYWLFRAGSAFLQAAATERRDPYQFFRDQYNNLRRSNPATADDEFLKRYGESYFVFAQSQTKSQTGIPSTQAAVALEQKYGDILAQHPELGALIVGPNGQGPFSPEAYTYQLNHPVAPGDAQMERTKMTADEAMRENQKRLGWSKITARLNELHAQLVNRGLTSFNDKGAEDLKAQKAAWVALYTSPEYPDGTPNPNYNEEFAKDWGTFDKGKYDRLIPALREVANSDLAKDPNRTDLLTLQEYLGARTEVTRLLAARKAAGGSDQITAKSNADLLDRWQYFVDSKIEQDTRFGDLHHRYLLRDLGVDATPQQQGGAQ